MRRRTLRSAWHERSCGGVAGEELEAVGGQILVVEAMVPHKFRTLGADLYEAVHIHANDRFETEWLE
ncbi:hypothetical protein ACFQHV_06345 [Promicromonospora thailandica]|uniref:hypothetical protein n=1 Tax=Promicromonospora thailandica TaxID=765201 RepID=UPI0020A3400C|nr:hypothetical protein [Promicromonospora thailandica]BFF20123.1 hypothetical protein GCM10025730_36440 [Promicromonospora thailandica]